MALRHVDMQGRPLLSTPKNVMALMAARSPVPTISYGGPRYLHLARQWTAHLYSQMKRILDEVGCARFLRELDSDTMLRLRFGRTDIDELDHSVPIMSEDRDMALTVHKAYKGTLLSHAGEMFTNEELQQAARRAACLLMELLYEWMRIFPHRIQTFLDKCFVTEEWRRNHRRYYEVICLIYFYIFDKQPVLVPEMEEILQRDMEETLGWQRAKVERQEKELIFMEHALRKLEHERDLGLSVDRHESRASIRVYVPGEDPGQDRTGAGSGVCE